MRKTNLLVDGHFLTGLGQGTRTYIIGLYNSLIEHYGDFYNLYVSGHSIEDVLSNINISPGNFLEYQYRSNYSRLTFELPYLIKKNDIEFAHFQQIAPFIKNCRHITTVHDVLFNDFPEHFSSSFRVSRNYLFKRSLKKSELKLTVSDYSKKKISQYFKIPESEIYVTPNGVEEKYFEDFSKQNSNLYLKKKYNLPQYVLYVSRLESRKNHIGLLKAFLQSKLVEKNWHLVFVGKETEKEIAFHQMLDSLNEELRTTIHHFENVSDSELIQFYRGADLFVYPSLAEGFGIPPLEAAACKVPVLCSNRTAMSDFRKLGITMFDPEDEDQFVKRLNQFTKSGALRNTSNVEDISKEVEEKYSWSASATILHNLIQDSRA